MQLRLPGRARERFGPIAPEWVSWYPSRPPTGLGTAPQSRSRNGRGPGTPGPARNGTVMQHPSQAPRGRGAAAPESIAPQSRPGRFSVGLATVAVPVGLVTAAVPAHPRPSPNGCGRRGQQGGLRAGKADGETKDDQTQVTRRRSLGH